MSKASYTAVRQYHDATKHHPHRMARSLGYMDWENQPNPFRSFAGTERVQLPLDGPDPEHPYLNLYNNGNIKPSELTIQTIAKLLELSMGLSAWKAQGRARWALRMNPSSGNLHPTETHLILPQVQGSLSAGLYHYAPLLHNLERRAKLSSEAVGPHLGKHCFLVAFSSIFWREAWKYGERALRYCLLDTGHALGALRFAANLLGWQAELLTGLDHDSAETLFGFDRTDWPAFEEEHLELVCRVHPADGADTSNPVFEDLLAAMARAPITGRPDPLSRNHQPWEIITTTAAHLRRKRPGLQRTAVPFFSDDPEAPVIPSAAAVIRRRRSGLAFRADAAMERGIFSSMLSKTLPRAGEAPFDNGFVSPEVHLLLFVHRVAGLDAGMYLLCRHPQDLDAFKSKMHGTFAWERADDALPLYLLQPGDVTRRAAEVSCRQAIAGDANFSLAMLARFDPVLRKAPRRYSDLFWEAGLIGQVLYLAGEAYGYRGTGIGCFFDDEVHRWAGIETGDFQSLYHFTLGKPIEDRRLRTYGPYRR